MKPDGFAADLYRKPEVLGRLSAMLADGNPGSTVIGVGGVVPGTQYNLRYPGDGDDTVRLLTEVLVPELMAARAWQAQRM